MGSAIGYYKLRPGEMQSRPLTEIIHFRQWFDFVDGFLVTTEPFVCASTRSLSKRRRAVRVFGHVGAFAFSRTSDFEQGNFNHRHVCASLC